AVKDAIQATHAAGMLFIAAAGNDGTNNDVIPHYPSSYDVANIVAVAATDHNDNLASFSCYGATSVDLSAPGVAILSTTPGNTYSSFQGTSMATPHVAGAAALLWANDPALTNLDVKEMLMATVDPVPGLAGRVVTGGRLNVYNALTCSPDVVNFIVSLDDGFFAEQELPIELSARLSACTLLRDAAVSAEFSNGDPTLDLTDDGVDPDLTADDGIYTAEWIPDALGPVTVTFAAWHAGDIYTTTATSDVVEFSGYYYDDTVPFSWIDISTTGTPLNLLDDDNAYISVPFPVSFYGASYDHISVGSNGHVYFEDSWSNYSNSCIPGDTGSANTFIAAFWDDLNPEAGGQVYTEVRGTAPSRMLIIQYQDIPHFLDAGAASFEIILYEDTDDIFVQYLDVGFGNAAYDFGASATVGVQRSSSYGQQYSCAEPVLADNTAILWYYWAQPTLTEIHLQDPNNGALLPSAPTFDWTADAGANNAFVIDVALFPSGPIHTLGLFYVTSWTIPNSTWDLIPHGSIMYWRVRGADLAQEPLTIITSDEIWWFYKY
ncbi:MAG: S8 family serine peptidase, partial [Candidatus Abyssubacteria bacterium]|nr:S8 family serine peptidase [Candidatus Abyssubacteria bacterium]